MAGRGPAPKDPSQRRNHHAPQRGEWIDLPPLEKKHLPDLPEFSGYVDDDGNQLRWGSRTIQTWKAWQGDPVTQLYSPADVAYALDTIALYEGMSRNNANEVRLRMDGLGLTPKGKRDLRWRIQAETAMAASANRKGPSASEKKASDRRARLTVVRG